MSSVNNFRSPVYYESSLPGYKVKQTVSQLFIKAFCSALSESSDLYTGLIFSLLKEK